MRNLALSIESPALHAPSACDSACMRLHHMSQILRSINHPDTARISLKTHCPPAIIIHILTGSNQTTQSVRSSQHKTNDVNNISLANTKQTSMHTTRYQRTPPEAIEATPLLNPTTETGVERDFVVASPSCKNQCHQRHVAAEPKQLATLKSTTEETCNT